MRSVVLVIDESRTFREMLGDTLIFELAALDAGADAFVRKGEDLEVVLAHLAAALRAAAAPPNAAASLLGPKRILVVDTDDAYLTRVGDALRGDGYDVVSARSGQEALALLAVQPIDCVLVEASAGGNDVCRRIKEARVGRAELRHLHTDVTALAQMVLGTLRRSSSGPPVDEVVQPDMSSFADPRLLQVVFENLLGNAWKLSSKADAPRVEVTKTEQGDFDIFHVRDTSTPRPSDVHPPKKKVS